MFVAFLGDSKVFDKINHNILFQRLKDNNIPLCSSTRLPVTN